MRMLDRRARCRRTVAWAWLAAAALGSADVSADPRLVGDQARVECRDALALAQAAFAGPSFTLDVSMTKPPAALQSRFAIAEDDDEDPVPASPPVDVDSLERIAPGDGAGTVLIWQRRAPGSRRWVETHYERGWHGTFYALYDVPVALGKDDLEQQLQPGKADAKAGMVAVFEGWQEPLFLHAPSDQALWVVDTGAPNLPLDAWRVIVQGDAGPVSPCSIDFGVEDKPSTIELLPPEFAPLDAMLLDALGPGIGEGTLHPTLRIQADAQRTWANIALRPWSLPQPWNTREEVDAGLQEWAAQDASQKIELARIHALYPRAERALSAYYRARFRLSGTQARRCAAHALDVAFRMHFVFHSDRAKQSQGDPPEPNPWPDRSAPEHAAGAHAR